MDTDRVYRTTGGIYAMWLGMLAIPLVPIAIDLEKFGWAQFQAKGLVMPSGLIIALLALATFWLASYRLTLSSHAISYRSWRTSWSIPYDQIAGISASRVAPISQMPIGAYVHFRDGRKELVYTKAFSLVAIRDLFALDNVA